MSDSPDERRKITDRFVRRQNIQHYNQLLNSVTDDTERKRLLKLLAEERQRQKDAGDPEKAAAQIGSVTIHFDMVQINRCLFP